MMSIKKSHLLREFCVWRHLDFLNDDLVKGLLLAFTSLNFGSF